MFEALRLLADTVELNDFHSSQRTYPHFLVICAP